MSAEVFEQMVEAVEGLIRRSIAPLADDLRAIEEWRKAVPQVKDGKDGLNGKDGSNGIDGKDGAPGLNGKDGAPGVDGKDGAPGISGKDGAPGRDGKDGARGLDGKDGSNGVNGKDGAPGLNGKDGANGKDGLNGKDGAPGVDGKEGPAGRDGRDGKDGKDGKDGRDGDPGKDGEKGAPGVGIDRLVVDQKTVEFILTDGSSAVVEMPVGPKGDKGADGINGKDGAPGLNGKDGAPGLNGRDGSNGIDGKDGAPGIRGEKGDPPSREEVESIVAKMLPDMLHKALDAAMQRAVPEIAAKAAALVPPGRDGLPGAPGRPGTRGEDGIDGKDGTNGKDGFGIEDFDVTLKEDGRTLVVKLANETQEVTKEIRLDIPVYQGVYKTGEYQRGDSVTYGGSLWIAKRLTNESPPSGDWQLAVKKGADAK